MNEKQDLITDPFFQPTLFDRIEKLRPHINIDKSKQKRGIRFNDNQFVLDKIVEAVDDFRRQANGTFMPDQPVDFLAESVNSGIYDAIIIDTLHVCSVADYVFENDIKYH